MPHLSSSKEPISRKTRHRVFCDISLTFPLDLKGVVLLFRVSCSNKMSSTIQCRNGGFKRQTIYLKLPVVVCSVALHVWTSPMRFTLTGMQNYFTIELPAGMISNEKTIYQIFAFSVFTDSNNLIWVNFILGQWVLPIIKSSNY